MFTDSLHNWQNYLRKSRLGLRLAVIVFTLVVIASVMIQSIGDLKSYAGIDLRGKVVGARLLIRGMNPYYDPRYEMHPDHLRMLNEDTYSPALLLLYAPLCEASWKTQRIVYSCVDWVCILLCFFILSRSFPKCTSREALWLAFVLLFIFGLGFRLHLERGQYYIELALLTSLAAVYLIRQRDSWFYALPLALLLLLRPTYAICIVCLLLLRRVRLAATTVSLCLALFALTLPLAGIRGWKNYLKEIRVNQLETAGAAYALVPTPPSSVQSQIVERVDFARSLSYPGYLADRTLTGLARGSVSQFPARMIHQIAPLESDFERLNFMGLLLAGLFDVTVMYGISRRRIVGLIPAAFVFLAPLNLELFAPQRFAYCDVTILAPTLLLMAATFDRSRKAGWGLYCAILTMGVALPSLAVHVDKHVPLASFLSYVGILITLNLICILETWGGTLSPIMRPVADTKQVGDCAAA